MTGRSPLADPYDAFGFDEAFYDRFIRGARPVHRWLRVRTEGLEHVPAHGPALLVANHAGFRVHDVTSLQVAIRDEHPAHRHVRTLGHRGAEKIPLWGRIAFQWAGCVIGHPRNAAYLLERGELVLVTPEGGHSAARPFRDRDRVEPPERWGDGWVRVAHATGVPVVPVAMSGFESAVPTVVRSRRLGRRWGMDDGLAPIAPQSLLVGLRPQAAGLLPLPVRCRIRIGEPVDVAGPLGEDPDDEAVHAASVRMRDALDGAVRDLAGERRGGRARRRRRRP